MNLQQTLEQEAEEFDGLALAGHNVSREEVIGFMVEHGGLYAPSVIACVEDGNDVTPLMEQAALTLLIRRHQLHKMGDAGATMGASSALEEADETPGELLTRHVRGDWGRHGRYAEVEIDDDIRENGPMATADDGQLNKPRWSRARGASCHLTY